MKPAKKILCIVLCILFGSLFPAGVLAEEDPCAGGHDFGEGVITAPGCTEPGCTTYTCSRCGETYTEPGEAATGHDYTAEVTTPATAETEGVMTWTCSRCQDSYTEAIPIEAADPQMPSDSAAQDEEPSMQEELAGGSSDEGGETVPAEGGSPAEGYSSDETTEEYTSQEEMTETDPADTVMPDTDPSTEKDKEEENGNNDPALCPAFSRSQTVDDVTVTVSADAGIFPEDAVLSVIRVPASETEQAIEAQRKEEQNVALSCSFEIGVSGTDGRALQPAEGQKVLVSFFAKDAVEAITVGQVWLISDGGTAEKLDPGAADTDADSGGQTVLSVEDTEKENEETGGSMVSIETDRLAIFTVEYICDSLRYVLSDGSETALSDVLQAVGLTGESETVQVSDPALFSVSDETGEWVIHPHQPFTEEERMTISIGTAVYTILVSCEEPAFYTVSVSACSNSSTASFSENTSITLMVPRLDDQGRLFVCWMEGGEVVTTDREYQFLVTADRNLTAIYE